MTNKATIAILTTAALIALGGCKSLSGGPIEGKVVDGVSRQPVAGAYVVVKWNTRAYGSSGGKDVCHHIEMSRTDSEGHFYIPEWQIHFKPGSKGSQMIFNPLAPHDSLHAYAFKPGFVDGDATHLQVSRNVTIPMKRVAGTEREWIEEWTKRAQFNWDCAAGSPTVRPVMEAVYKVLKRHPESKEATGHAGLIEDRLASREYEVGWWFD